MTWKYWVSVIDIFVVIEKIPEIKMEKLDTAAWIEKDKKQLHPTYHP
jgi:hypothetical protein